MSVLIRVIDKDGQGIIIDNRSYNEKKAKTVIQLDKEGNYVARYPSIAEAERATGIRHIYECVSGKNKRKTAGGYQWELEGDIDYGK